MSADESVGMGREKTCWRVEVETSSCASGKINELQCSHSKSPAKNSLASESVPESHGPKCCHYNEKRKSYRAPCSCKASRFPSLTSSVCLFQTQRSQDHWRTKQTNSAERNLLIPVQSLDLKWHRQINGKSISVPVVSWNSSNSHTRQHFRRINRTNILLQF